MTAGGAQPGVADRREDESGDRPLATLLIAIEQVDHEAMGMRHDLVELGAIVVIVVAYRALPEPVVTGRDVQVP